MELFSFYFTLYFY